MWHSHLSIAYTWMLLRTNPLKKINIWTTHWSDPRLPTTQGARGPTGPRGILGPKGIKGVKGIDGAQGLHGDEGNQGAPGPPGPRGRRGREGRRGEEGNLGKNGPNGAPGAMVSDQWGRFMSMNEISICVCQGSALDHCCICYFCHAVVQCFPTVSVSFFSASVQSCLCVFRVILALRASSIIRCNQFFCSNLQNRFFILLLKLRSCNSYHRDCTWFMSHTNEPYHRWTSHVTHKGVMLHISQSRHT